ncbi:glycoside hydrolase family 3 N-terminal domain-containing protein [Actinocrinis sp.]|uniref:glycoside hydrolase family 3 N-terminal domain-containing protein n=1 Tax=Actinocrinis sp. TaxID=1920516 RepID=UPI002D65AC22|nr:glycoside hydrolase family 3 N-terminal domain-containing protein [Actinocrinis sp.]HZP51251.1 glycoside hydrolase family 3 N-terminal domain-containing protein [Actinocrinis sp.]
MAEPTAPGQESNGARPSRRALLAGTAGLGMAGAFGWWQATPDGTGQRLGDRRPIPQPGATAMVSFPLGLSDLQLAGQRVIFSYPGTTPPASLLSDISAGLVGGVIFFGENITSASQIAGVIAQLRQAAKSGPIKQPLLLMTDQEGGLVRRLPGQPTLSAKQMGQAADPVAAASAGGTGAGQNLRGVGMNVNLAPVLDVFYTAGNFIDQYQRSFSNDPATVAALGSAFISAQQATRVAATAKHFPGLGSAATSQNTDLEAVTLNVSLNQLHTIDEVPYPAAISAGVMLVMCSWALYPALDPSLPAGLSPTIVNGELRGRNGFRGVTITDALEAGALSAYGSTAQRAVKAAAAGMDLILCSARDVSQGQSARNALATALGNGTLDSTSFHAATERIGWLRSALP